MGDGCPVVSAGAATSGDAIPVVLVGDEEPSGLAEMLQQFIEQTVAESPHKAGQARRLAGRAVFRSAEDEALCVHIAFMGNHVELQDGGAPRPGEASITADFLTIAHLTAGRASPFRLLVQRKLKARFSPRQVPFLLGMLRFMQIESQPRRRAWLRWTWPAAVAVAGAAVYWYVRAAR